MDELMLRTPLPTVSCRGLAPPTLRAGLEEARGPRHVAAAPIAPQTLTPFHLPLSSTVAIPSSEWP